MFIYILEKLAEATRKYAALQSELKTALELQQGSGKNKGKANVKPVLSTRKLRDLKLAFSEFYLSLILLQNYQNLNHTGFRKILKKHDKVLQYLHVFCNLTLISHSLCNFRMSFLQSYLNIITIFPIVEK